MRQHQEEEMLNWQNEIGRKKSPHFKYDPTGGNATTERFNPERKGTIAR